MPPRSTPPASSPPNDILSAAEAAYSGLRLILEEPTEAELATGTRRFSYSEDQWAVSGAARLEGPAARLLTLEVRPSVPDGFVSSSMVKGIPVGRIVGSLQTLLSLDRARRQGVESEPKEDAPEPKRPRRGGKPAVTDDLLRSLAEAYLAETAEGKPAHPLARVSEQFDRPQETVRTWLSRARKEGWLAPGVKGRAGGEPGPKLLAARIADELELGPHPEDEPLSEKMARDGRRVRRINEGVAKWEEMRRHRPEGQRIPEEISDPR